MYTPSAHTTQVRMSNIQHRIPNSLRHRLHRCSVGLSKTLSLVPCCAVGLVGTAAGLQSGTAGSLQILTWPTPPFHPNPPQQQQQQQPQLQQLQVQCLTLLSPFLFRVLFFLVLFRVGALVSTTSCDLLSSAESYRTRLAHGSTVHLLSM